MMDLHLNFQLSEAQVLTLLRLLVGGPCIGVELAEIRKQLTKLETHLMKQDESIAALKTANDALKETVTTAFAEFDAALTNIKADEAALIAKLDTLTDLTPANQAIVDGVIADSQALGASIQAKADALKKVADDVADEEPPAQP